MLLAYMLFLFVVFGFSAFTARHRSTMFDESVLNSAFYPVSASCIVCGIAVIVPYHAGTGRLAYFWYLDPLCLFSGYLLHIRLFIEQKG